MKMSQKKGYVVSFRINCFRRNGLRTPRSMAAFFLQISIDIQTLIHFSCRNRIKKENKQSKWKCFEIFRTNGWETNTSRITRFHVNL